MVQQNARNRQSVLKTLQVNEDIQLLEFLNANIKDLSRNKIKSFLSKKLFAVNGKRISQFDFVLHPGMRVEMVKSMSNVFPDNPYISLVYEDRWLVVIDKNPGILSMQSDHHSFCVKSIRDNDFRHSRQHCTAHVVHRLDRETSGLMIFAKSTEVQQLFVNSWQELIKDRRYVALVSGKMQQTDGTMRSWLKDDKYYFTYSSPFDNGGKYAVTHFHTVRTSERYSLVELSLETGRKNQIRVHMQDLRHPVVGDLKYGFEDDNPIGRLGLHAFRLDFEHPVTGQILRFETPYPTAFRTVF